MPLSAVYPKNVEGSYCKRPIQCLASSKILTSHPHLPASVNPPPLMRGKDTLAGWKGGGGSIFWKTPDTALYSTYVRTLCLKSGGHEDVAPSYMSPNAGDRGLGASDR